MFLSETPAEDRLPSLNVPSLLLSLSVHGSSLRSAFASSASLVVLLGCVLLRLRVPPFLLPLRGVAVLSASSRRVERGGSYLFFCILLKRVCGRPRAGCLVCIRLLSVVCRPCLVLCVNMMHACVIVYGVCAREFVPLRLCDMCLYSLALFFICYIVLWLPSRSLFSPRSSAGPPFLRYG